MDQETTLAKRVNILMNYPRASIGHAVVIEKINLFPIFPQKYLHVGKICVVSPNKSFLGTKD